MKLYYSPTIGRSGLTIHPSEMEEGEYGRLGRWGTDRYYSEYRCKCENGWLLTQRDDSIDWSKSWKMTDFESPIWYPKEHYEITIE